MKVLLALVNLLPEYYLVFRGGSYSTFRLLSRLPLARILSTFIASVVGFPPRLWLEASMSMQHAPSRSSWLTYMHSNPSKRFLSLRGTQKQWPGWVTILSAPHQSPSLSLALPKKTGLLCSSRHSKSHRKQGEAKAKALGSTGTVSQPGTRGSFWYGRAVLPETICSDPSLSRVSYSFYLSLSCQ